MKRRPAGLLALTCASALMIAGCGSGGGSSSSSTTAKSNSSAPLHADVPSQFRNGFSVGVQDGTPPEAYLDSSGQPTGVSPALVREIGALLGVPITIDATTFENELLGLSAGRYPFVTDTNITAEREGLYQQLPYYYDDYSFIGLKSAPAIGSSISDLCGMSVADEVGDAAIPFIQAYSKTCTQSGKKAITLVQVPSFGACLLALRSGRVQAVTSPVDFIHYEVSQPSASDLRVTGPEYNKVAVGLSFPKTSKLAAVVQKALTMLIKNGAYQKTMEQYGYGSDLQFTSVSLDPTPLTPTP
jgi:polar amino acid transport system substrate-binding protein